jgi:hypothetical protein
MAPVSLKWSASTRNIFLKKNRQTRRSLIQLPVSLDSLAGSPVLRWIRRVSAN